MRDTQTQITIGDVFKNIYYENRENTNLTEYDKNVPDAYKQHSNVECNHLL